MAHRPLDGPTGDHSAGVRVEFESSKVLFNKRGSSAEDTDQAKDQQVGDRQGDNWQLTADTTSETARLLAATYIWCSIRSGFKQHCKDAPDKWDASLQCADWF